MNVWIFCGWNFDRYIDDKFRSLFRNARQILTLWPRRESHASVFVVLTSGWIRKESFFCEWFDPGSRFQIFEEKHIIGGRLQSLADLLNRFSIRHEFRPPVSGARFQRSCLRYADISDQAEISQGH